MLAYRSGNYESAGRLWEHMLGAEQVNESSKRGFQALKEACDQAMEGDVPKVEWVRDIPEFDPYAGFDIAKLLGRPFERSAVEDEH